MQPEPSGRLRLLETIRAFALDAPGGERREVADRHLAWAAGLAQRHEPAVVGAHPAALDDLEAELPNLRAALDHAADGPTPEHAGLRLLAALPWFFNLRGLAIEGWTGPGRCSPPTPTRRSRCVPGPGGRPR
ncbi:MAG: hypothetical protein ACT4RN_15815 [Pseudonocardia sp.]